MKNSLMWFFYFVVLFGLIVTGMNGFEHWLACFLFVAVVFYSHYYFKGRQRKRRPD